MSINAAYWITELAVANPDVSIASLTIPGTHDSATSYGTTSVFGIDRYTVCQSKTISEQLNDGIRFFDIRVGTDSNAADDSMPIYHGKYKINYTLKQVLSDFVTFLKGDASKSMPAHSSETILCCLKLDDGDGTHGVYQTYQKLKQDLNNGGDFFYDNPVIPTLRQAQGKIVLFRRFDLPSGVTDCGINIRTFDSQGEANADTQGYYVQDHYSESSSNDKIKEVKKGIKDALAGASSKLFFNFWSAAYNPVTSPKGMADNVNPKMGRHILTNSDLASSSRLRLGINIMDFYDPDIVRILIAYNFNSVPDSPAVQKVLTIPGRRVHILNLERVRRPAHDTYLDAGDGTPYCSKFGGENTYTMWIIEKLPGRFNVVQIKSVKEPNKCLSIAANGMAYLSEDTNSAWFVEDNGCVEGYVRFKWWTGIGKSSGNYYLDSNLSGQTVYAGKFDHSNRHIQWKVEHSSW